MRYVAWRGVAWRGVACVGNGEAAAVMAAAAVAAAWCARRWARDTNGRDAGQSKGRGAPGWQGGGCRRLGSRLPARLQARLQAATGLLCEARRVALEGAILARELRVLLQQEVQLHLAQVEALAHVRPLRNGGVGQVQVQVQVQASRRCAARAARAARRGGRGSPQQLVDLGVQLLVLGDDDLLLPALLARQGDVRLDPRLHLLDLVVVVVQQRGHDELVGHPGARLLLRRPRAAAVAVARPRGFRLCLLVAAESRVQPVHLLDQERVRLAQPGVSRLRLLLLLQLLLLLLLLLPPPLLPLLMLLLMLLLLSQLA